MLNFQSFRVKYQCLLLAVPFQGFWTSTIFETNNYSSHLNVQRNHVWCLYPFYLSETNTPLLERSSYDHHFSYIIHYFLWYVYIMYIYIYKYVYIYILLWVYIYYYFGITIIFYFNHRFSWDIYIYISYHIIKILLYHHIDIMISYQIIWSHHMSHISLSYQITSSHTIPWYPKISYYLIFSFHEVIIVIQRLVVSTCGGDPQNHPFDVRKFTIILSY